MHHIYHTEGIILGSRSFGEAGRYYYILTRELGLVYASAQGVRKMSSKLRFILQDFAYVKADLIQGRNTWRVASASKSGKLEKLSKNRMALKVFSNIAKLLRRLLAGVEANEVLFMDLYNGLTIMEDTTDEADFQNIEVVLVLRILHSLGYIGRNAALDNLIRSPFEKELIFRIAKDRNRVVQEINQALRETQM